MERVGEGGGGFAAGMGLFCFCCRCAGGDCALKSASEALSGFLQKSDTSTCHLTSPPGTKVWSPVARVFSGLGFRSRRFTACLSKLVSKLYHQGSRFWFRDWWGSCLMPYSSICSTHSTVASNSAVFLTHPRAECLDCRLVFCLRV